MDDDAALLEAYVSRDDEEAFGRLVRKHLALVYGTAMRQLGDHHLSEEISQNVFCALAGAGMARKQILNIPAWLYGCTRRQLALTMRTEKRRREREARAAEHRHQESLVYETDVPHLHADSIHAAMGRLARRDQSVLVMRFYDGHTLRDLGAKLGIEERAAQKRVHRAMNRLRDLLLKQGVVMTPALLGSQLFRADAAIAPPGSLASTIAKRAVSAPVSQSVSTWFLVHVTPWPLILTTVLITASLIAVRLPWSTNAVSTGGSVAEGVVANPGELLTANGITSAGQAKQTIAIDDIEAIYRLEPGERELYLKRLLRYLESKDDEEYLWDLITRWSRLEPSRCAEGLVQLFRASHENEMHSALLGGLLAIPVQVWANGDAGAVRAWVTALPRSDYAEAHAHEALLAWEAMQDLTTAYEWLINRPFNRSSAYEILAAAIADQLDTAAALEYLEALSEDRERFVSAQRHAQLGMTQRAGAAKTALWLAVLPKLFEREQKIICEWLADLPPSKHTTEAIGAVATLWAREFPAASGTWAASLDYEDERRAALVAVAREWSQHDLTNALTWGDALEDGRWPVIETCLLHGSVDRQIGAWAVGQWGASPEAQIAFTLLSERLTGDEAWELAFLLRDEGNKDAVLEQAAFQFGKETPAEGLARIDALGMPAEQELAWKALCMGWIVGGGKKDLDRWRQSLDPHTAAYAAAAVSEIDLLAAVDPVKTSVYLFGLERGPWRDEAIARLVARAMHRSEAMSAKAVDWVEAIEDQSRRRALRHQVELARDALEHAGPTRSPNMNEVQFEEQSLRQLRERLDLISSIP